ncbi:MAG: type I-E CRISPR-associated protein Cas5/CasD [Endomicrobium sp.]|jgi:CRISPR system Cascade subunit CasD|nr:type I-E CRISPR-associated protein Cas5/CasD [Endomicrobium sp.]
MQNTLVLYFDAPIQSWGCHTYEDDRPTELFPTRSAITGLLAACLGIDRENQEEIISLDKSYKVAVIVEKQGIRKEDYQTIRNAPLVSRETNKHAIISRKSYIFDGKFIVLLQFSNNAEYNIEKIISAIKKPVFTPFLGRRSCPITCPLFINEEKNLLQEDSLNNAVNIVFNRIQNNENKPTRIYSEDILENGVQISVRDVPSSIGKKIYSQRTVYMCEGNYVFK